MLELHVQDTVVQSGSVGISWCLTPEMAKAIAASGEEAHLLLIVLPQEGAAGSAGEVRKVVPLKSLFTFIEFARPGRNRVFGRILLGNKNAVRNHALRRTDGRWNTSMVVNGEDKLFPCASAFVNTIEGGDGTLDIIAPQGVFAKEPAAWEKAWVNRFFGGAVADQCGFRRRRLFAYTIQPLLWLVCWTLWLPVVAVCVSLGLRSITFGVLRDPFSTHIVEFMDDLEGSYFWPKSKKFDEGPLFLTKFLSVAYMPAVPLMTYAIARGNHAEHALAWGLAFPLAMGIALAVIVVCFLGILTALEARKESKNADDIVADEDLEALVCGGRPKFSVADLPSNRRTVVLRFLELKAKVCRPFAR